MRKIFFALMLTASASQAQDVYDTMAIESCNCITAKRPNPETTPPAELRADFVSCFFQSFTTHMEEVNKLEKIDMGNETQMEKLGETVAMRMLSHCPNHLVALGQAIEGQEEASEVKYTTVQGKITEIRTEQFITLVMKDKSNRTHNLMLMDFFESASLITENKIKKNDEISATFSEIEMYDPKLKEFRYFKVLSELEKK